MNSDMRSNGMKSIHRKLQKELAAWLDVTDPLVPNRFTHEMSELQRFTRVGACTVLINRHTDEGVLEWRQIVHYPKKKILGTGTGPVME